DMLVATARAEEQGAELAAQNERSDGVDELDLQHLGRRDFAEAHAPAVHGSEVHLLQVRIELTLGEDVDAVAQVIRQNRYLRHFGGREKSGGYASHLPSRVADESALCVIRRGGR